MLYKKIKKLLLTILLITVIFIGVRFTQNNQMQNNSYIPKPTQEYKMDLTKFKIQDVLATNKLQTLEITFTTQLNDSRYDKPRFEMLDGLSKMLTSRELTIQGKYKALFTYNLEKAQFTSNGDNTHTILLNSNDIEINLVQVGDLKTSERTSAIGRYYNSEVVSKISSQMVELANQEISTQEYYNKATENTKDNLIKILQGVGVDMSNINIIINN